MAGFASVTATVGAKLKVVAVSNDVSPDGAFSADAKSRTFSNWDTEFKLDATTQPKVEQAAFTKVTLSGGAATLDMTAILMTDGNTLDATGKKLIAYRFMNPNNNPVTVAPGASNGYDFAGAGKDVDVPAFEDVTGRPFKVGQAPSRAAVSGTDKTLDFTGNGTDVILVSLLFGSSAS